MTTPLTLVLACGVLLRMTTPFNPGSHLRRPPQNDNPFNPGSRLRRPPQNDTLPVIPALSRNPVFKKEKTRSWSKRLLVSELPCARITEIRFKGSSRLSNHNQNSQPTSSPSRYSIFFILSEDAVILQGVAFTHLKCYRRWYGSLK